MEPFPIALLIPILGTVMGISLAMLAVYLGYRRQSEALKLAHQERMAAIEKGIELPPSLAPSQEERVPDVQRQWRSLAHQRRSGLILLFLGATVGVAMWESGNEAFVWGLIPAAIGLAQLVASALEARDLRRQHPDGKDVPGPQG